MRIFIACVTSVYVFYRCIKVMNYSSLSFKKKLGFASLLVLVSLAHPFSGFAMDNMEQHEGETGESDENDSKLEKSGSRKRRHANGGDEGRKKRLRNNAVPPSAPSTPAIPSDAIAPYSAAPSPAPLDVLADVAVLTPPSSTAASSSENVVDVSASSRFSVVENGSHVLPPLTLDEINILIVQAKQNDREAQAKLMKYFSSGLYVPYLEPQKIGFLNWKSPNPEQTFQAYCCENDVYARYILWNFDTVGANFPGILDAVKRRASQGNALAQNNLGNTYWHGRGVKQDYIQAAQYYQLAADQGYANAQNNLGIAYWHGNGVQQDVEQAVKYYQLAADQGHATAQNNLGIAYWNGKGVKQDVEQAVQYFKLAADQGDAKAQYVLGNVYWNGQGVKQDFEQAVKYFKLAADQGHARAQCTLGNAYANDKGVKQDVEQAVKYYQLAADQGFAMAWNSLGNMYWNDQGVKQDFEKAVKYYQLAVDQGSAVAQSNLSTAYELGKGVKKNMATALYYKMASKNATHNPFVSTHLSYVPFVAQQNEKCADKLKKISDKEKKTTPQGGLAYLLNRHQEKREKEEKQTFPIPEISRLYQKIIQIEEDAIALFDQLPQAIKKGFMVPGMHPGSPEVEKDCAEQSLPLQLGACVIDGVNYLTFGEQNLKLRELLFGIDEKVNLIHQALETLSVKYYNKDEYDRIQREIVSKRGNPQSEVQKDCETLYARMQSLSPPLAEIQKERDLLDEIRREVKSFIPSTAKDRQDIFLSEYPAIPRKR